MPSAKEGFLWVVLESNRAERQKCPVGIFSEGARLCGGAYWSRTSDLLPVKQAF